MKDVVYITSSLLSEIVLALKSMDHSDSLWVRKTSTARGKTVCKYVTNVVKIRGIEYTVIFERRWGKSVIDNIIIRKPLTSYSFNVHAGCVKELKKELRNLFNDVIAPIASSKEEGAAILSIMVDDNDGV